MLSQVDFELTCGGKDHMQVNKLYQVLTGELGMDLTVSELKSLNAYLLSKQNEANSSNEVQFLDQDEQTVDLRFLQKFLKPRGQQSGSNNQEVVDQLQAEIRRLKLLQQGDTDYMLAKNQQL